eukprot:CAMPEP_0182855090 /NCGR_PEP_ID=MMETSP0034_2-20130328/1642_1 /TAXON_ID=156128 /ORGANISM="Nephroselmis pyriformis, Strain CCMP717" /LENGTH=56 /DNA_ID=CAMNT_0024986001 /DNA_START=62 /DNA_END=229 /DNA_ORIENTATION=+
MTALPPRDFSSAKHCEARPNRTRQLRNRAILWVILMQPPRSGGMLRPQGRWGSSSS